VVAVADAIAEMLLCKLPAVGLAGVQAALGVLLFRGIFLRWLVGAVRT
jgi:hypothetical protein